MDIWSTQDLAPAHQFDAWRRHLQERCCPAEVGRRAEADAPFAARVATLRIGSFHGRALQAPGHRMTLCGSRAPDRDDCCFIVQFVAPAVVRGAGRSVDLAAGAVLLIDPRYDEQIDERGDIRYRALSVPRPLVASHAAARHWTDALLPVGPDQPLGSLVSGYADALFREGERLPSPIADAAVASLCRLIGLGVGGDADLPELPPVRAARLVRVKRAIAQRLADPELSPATLAPALGMSSRNLHLLFRDSGQTFSEYVMARRLAECRAALTDPSQAGRSVTDIAFGCGFANLNTFYRAFRAAFQMTPLELRTRHAASPQLTKY